MKYLDLRDFIKQLSTIGELENIMEPISPDLEMTAISDKVLRAKGPALLFQQPLDHSMPALTNLFGTTKRVALAMGRDSAKELREIGQLLAYLKAPEPPSGFRDAFDKLPLLKKIMTMSPKLIKKAPCQQIVLTGNEVDLGMLPVQRCWPGDIAPLITWGLVTTRGPDKARQNMGIYRQQVLAKNKVIMRWLSHRGGALDYQAWCKKFPKKPFPIAVTLGADPATILAAVTPIPDTLSEYAFAGLLRGSKTELTQCLTHELQVPASGEIILEGYIYPGEEAKEGPYGDHTGYYNEVETFPVFTIERMTMRDAPIYFLANILASLD